MTFNLYLANSNGQKISGYSKIEADTLQSARAIYRLQLAKKGIKGPGYEILCDS